MFTHVQIDTLKINSKKALQNCFIKPLVLGLEVLTAVVMKSIMFWDLPWCNPSEVHLEDGGNTSL
jgi:hypothetical protein